MTLATHAIAGAALASLIPTHPVGAFCAGFASHFLLDAIPHYDYPIYSDSIHPKKKNRPVILNGALVRDGADFSFDAGVGILVSLIAFASPMSVIAILAGAVGGILPDPLQVVAKKFPHEPFRSLQKFHQWIHAKWRLRETGHVWTGVISQLVLVLLVIGIAQIIASN